MTTCKKLGDFPIRLHPSPPSPPPVSPAELKAWIRGMVALANPGFGPDEIAKETNEVLKAYNKGGPLVRLLRQFVLGEVQKRQRLPDYDTTRKRFEACVRVKRMTSSERQIICANDKRLKGKRGKSTTDTYRIAAALSEPALEDVANAAKSYRKAYDVGKRAYGWTEADVAEPSLDSMFDPGPPIRNAN